MISSLNGINKSKVISCYSQINVSDELYIYKLPEYLESFNIVPICKHNMHIFVRLFQYKYRVPLWLQISFSRTDERNIDVVTYPERSNMSQYTLCNT